MFAVGAAARLSCVRPLPAFWMLAKLKDPPVTMSNCSSLSSNALMLLTIENLLLCILILVRQLAIGSFLLTLICLADTCAFLLQVAKIEHRYVCCGSNCKIELCEAIASVLDASKIEGPASDYVQLLVAQFKCIDVVNH